MKTKWTCGCGNVHHLEPGTKEYTCRFCGHEMGKEAPAPVKAEAEEAVPVKAEAEEAVETHEAGPETHEAQPETHEAGPETVVAAKTTADTTAEEATH